MDLTMEIDKILEQRKRSIDSCKLSDVNSQLSTDKCKLLTDKEIDSILAIVNDLITPKYRAWHIGMLFKVGPNRYLAIADQARKRGREEAKYFSALLKRA